MKKEVSLSETPYDRCLTCHFRVERKCDGPRTSSMDLRDWCNFMRSLKIANGLTNADIAVEADVSVKTVDRLLALKYDKDILRDTARRIENAIMHSSNRYPCFLAAEGGDPLDTSGMERLNEATRELERALADNRDYRAALDGIHESYQTEIQRLREADLERIADLRDQVERLRRENDNLWRDNNRKAQMVDDLWRQQKGVLED